MNARPAWPVPPGDPRHPHWCSPLACRAGVAGGDHRSQPITIVRANPSSEQSTVWLSQVGSDPLAESTVFLNVRVEQLAPSGEPDLLVTHAFFLVEAGQLAAVMSLLTARGEDRTLVGPEDWR